MKVFEVEAMENFLVRTRYLVDAETEEEAEQLCKEGRVAYVDHSVQEGDDEWLETLGVQETSLEVGSNPPEVEAMPTDHKHIGRR